MTLICPKCYRRATGAETACPVCGVGLIEVHDASQRQGAPLGWSPSGVRAPGWGAPPQTVAAGGLAPAPAAPPTAGNLHGPALPTTARGRETLSGPDLGPAANGEDDGDLTGRQLGNFRIEGILGRGGMGAVYRARHVALGTLAVVKVMLQDLARDSRDSREAQRFLNEARLGSSIQHPNVVRIFDYGTLPSGAPYMVMELLEGEDLHERIAREGRMDPVHTARILRAVASALWAAHSRKDGATIHRDLKPANIRIGERGGQEHVTVLDFGIARVVEQDGSPGPRLTLPGTLIGTPAYMSPEQAMADPLDGRSDIYALGVVAYEMLTGRLPFVAPRSVQVIAMHVQEPPPAIPPELGVPEPLAALVMRCLQKLPEERPQTALEVVDALDAFLAEATGGRERGGRRLGPLAWVAAVVLVAGAIALGYALSRAEAPALTARVTALTGGSDANGEAGGRDLLEGRTLFTATPTLWLSGEVALDGEAGTPRIELRRAGAAGGAGGAALARAPLEAGKFRLFARLDAGERAALDLVLAWTDAGGAERERVLANKTIVCDSRAPTVRLLAGDGARVDAERGVVYARRATLALAIEAHDDVGLAEPAVTAQITPPARAFVEAGPEGPRLALDLSDLSGDEVIEVTLVARDLAGNEGRIAQRVVLDLTEPQVRWSSLDEEPIAGRAALPVAIDDERERRVRLEALVADAGGIDRVELVIVGPAGASATRPPDARRDVADRTEVRFSVPLAEVGTYALKLRATDRAGNEGVAALSLEAYREMLVEVGLMAVRGGAGALEPAALPGEELAEMLRLGRLAPRSPDGPRSLEGEPPYHIFEARVGAWPLANQPIAGGRLWIEADGEPAREVALAPEGADRQATHGVLVLYPDRAQTLHMELSASEGPALPFRHSIELVHDGTPPAVTLEGMPWPALIGPGHPAVDGQALLVRARVTDAHLYDTATVRFAAEPDEARAAALAEALARGAPPARAGFTAQQAALDEEAVVAARVPLVDGAWVVVGVEARDLAGNRGFAAARTRVDLRPPAFAPFPRTRFPVHEPIEVAIQLDEPVEGLTVDGSTDGLSARPGGGFVYRAGPMVLDSPLELALEARDAAGNVGRATLRLERDLTCSRSGKPLPDSFVQRVLTGGVRPFCPLCEGGQEPLLRSALPPR